MRTIRKCYCGCGRDVVELEVYKRFCLMMYPYSSHGLQVVAEPMDEDSLTEILIDAEFSDYGTLRDDNCHSHTPDKPVEIIVKRIKENIDLFQKRREEIVQAIIKERLSS